MEVPDDDVENSQYKKKERLWALCKSAARFFNEQLKTPGASEVRAYALKRGLSPSTITRFGLGFAPDGFSSLTPYLMSKGYTAEDFRRVAHRIDEVVRQMMAEKAAQA